MSLRTRIAAATALALAIVAVASAVTIYTVIRSELHAEVLRSLRQTARPIRDDLRPNRGPDTDDVIPAPPDIGGPGDRSRRQFGGAAGYVQFVRSDGTAVRTRDEETALPINARDRRIATDGVGEQLREVHVEDAHLLVLTQATAAGAVQVARPLDESDHVLGRALEVLVAVSIGGVLLALVLGLVIARGALRPVRRFTRQAEDIAREPRAGARLDVTGSDEISRLAGSFNLTLAALEESLGAQRQLTADAGHELRTPIASLRANIQVLDDEASATLPAEDMASLRRDIVLELDELTELVADVVELARGSDPGAPHDVVALDEIVRDVAERAQRRGTSRVDLQLDLEATLVHGDGPRIARAITNVVDNARKWSPEGGRIEVTLRDGALTVRDHGPGIPEGDLPHVFERFYRADTARSMPGSGLGLAIVQQTVASHGGTVVASNAADGDTGAVFALSFGPVVTAGDPGTGTDPGDSPNIGT